jgi:hypothetical protein
MLLDGKDLEFYQYNGDVNELLDGVRASLNELAEHWTREQKDHCLRETADAFQVKILAALCCAVLGYCCILDQGRAAFLAFSVCG